MRDRCCCLKCRCFILKIKIPLNTRINPESGGKNVPTAACNPSIYGPLVLKYLQEVIVPSTVSRSREIIFLFHNDTVWVELTDRISVCWDVFNDR